MSALLHGSVIALAVIAWPRLMPPIDLPDQVVPVDLLPPSDETNIKPQEKSEKPVPEPTPQPPPPPEPATAAAADEAAPSPPEPEALAAPEPLPPPPVPAKPVPAPPLQRFAMAHPRAKPKPEKAPPDFDALLNRLAKDPSKTQAPATPVKPAQAARATAGVGAQTAMTESEIDALRSQMMKCWNVPVGAPDPTALVLRLRVALNQDGSVAGMPQLMDTLSLGDPYFRAASESAIRAVKMCGPYKLPVEKYDAWNDVIVTFDPTKMAGY